MEQNVGKTDKIVRSVVVILFLYLGYSYSWIFYLLAALLLYTVVTGSCLPYKLLGINTCPVNKK